MALLGKEYFPFTERVLTMHQSPRHSRAAGHEKNDSPFDKARISMSKKQKSPSTALVQAMSRVAWKEYPGHFGGALSKALVDIGNSGSKQLDFRISRYAPAAYVQEHTHKVQEQVYYVLEGEGILTLDDAPHLMRAHDYVYVPPGVRHSFTNTGIHGLVFLVITSPASDDEELQ
jgi:quercetin dioxygenase-like cupin family protein